MVDQTANFVRGNADAAISAGDTTISVVDASEFPDPANGEYNLTLWNGDGRPDQDPDVELVRVTGRDTGTNDLTVERAQEGTGDASHPDGSALQLGTTAKVIDNLAAQFTRVEVFTADGTFDATGIDTALVECVGGGGGGGGVVGNGTDTIQVGASGGGGEYVVATVDLSATTSVTVTVGSGGGTNSSGGSSDFGGFATADGGGGSAGDVDGDNPQPGTGGSGGVGDVTVPGQEGALGSSTTDSYSGAKAIKNNRGGDSVLGSGGFKGVSTGELNLATGSDGDVYGGGGGGAVASDNTGNTNDLAGGSGADGIVIVRY